MRFLIVLALLASPAAAQQVHKCPGKDGVPVYQSEPCPDGNAQKTWDASQPYVSPANQARIDRQRREAEQAQQQRRQVSNAPVFRQSVPPGPTQNQTKHARCEAAKRERDAALERLGLRRTFEDLRRWQDHVNRYCQ